MHAIWPWAISCCVLPRYSPLSTLATMLNEQPARNLIWRSVPARARVTLTILYTRSYFRVNFRALVRKSSLFEQIEVNKVNGIVGTSCLRSRNHDSKDIWSAMRDTVAGVTEQARTFPFPWLDRYKSVRAYNVYGHERTLASTRLNSPVQIAQSCLPTIRVKNTSLLPRFPVCR